MRCAIWKYIFIKISVLNGSANESEYSTKGNPSDDSFHSKQDQMTDGENNLSFFAN